MSLRQTQAKRPITARRRLQRGSQLLEAAMLLPVVAMLLFGMVEIARITWTYYTLHKVLYAVGRFAAVQPTINFCNDTDTALINAKNLAIHGDGPNGGQLLLPNLTAEVIEVRLERINVETEGLVECDCSSTGCDAAQGGRPPDFVVVTIPDGYQVRTNIPFMPSESFPLRPLVRVPVGTL